MATALYFFAFAVGTAEAFVSFSAAYHSPYGSTGSGSGVETPYGSGYGTPYGSGGGYYNGVSGSGYSGSGANIAATSAHYYGGSTTSATAQPSCNEEYRMRDNEAEFIQTPNWPAKYPSNQHCIYKFESRSGKPLKLTFKMFDIEYNKWCNWDYVKIYDGSVKPSNKLDKLCGSEEDGEFVTKGKVLNVVFHSDSSVQRGGFDAKVTVDVKKSSSSEDYHQRTLTTIRKIEQEINDEEEDEDEEELDDDFFENFINLK